MNRETKKQTELGIMEMTPTLILADLRELESQRDLIDPMIDADIAEIYDAAIERTWEDWISETALEFCAERNPQ